MLKRLSIFLVSVAGFFCTYPGFAADPLELFARHCVTCHNASDPKAGLDLSQAETALKGGDSGAVIVAGKPGESLLLERVADGSMPPEHDGRRLTNAEVAILKKWIADGAVWPKERRLSQFEWTTDKRAGYDWWSLQPLHLAPLPFVSDQHYSSFADTFIIHRLAAVGVSLAAPADRRMLIRRATFDLLGLPPTPEEVSQFLADPAPDAFERLLDRLLASPHYGERWGRHWLDVVRYGESDGFEHDKYREHSWPYRDYVIRSLNADKPYREFVTEQLAGDVLPNATRDQIAATGFLVAGPWDEIQNVGASPTEKRRAREEQQEELIAAVAQTFLGLTVNCARCHDHKFDPLPQTDYYHWKAALDGVDHGARPWLTAAEKRDWDEKLKPLQDELARTKSNLADLAKQFPADARLEKGEPDKLVPGRFGNTFSPQQAQVAAPHADAYDSPPLTIECWAKLNSQSGFNILVACNPKSSSEHWELYTFAGSGELSFYAPGYKPAEIKSGVRVTDGQWHHLAATLSEQRVQLFVDGKWVHSATISRQRKPDDKHGPLQFGGIVEHKLSCDGLVDEVRLSRGVRKIESLPTSPFTADEATLALWHFDEAHGGFFADFAKPGEEVSKKELSGDVLKDIRAQQQTLRERQLLFEKQLAEKVPPKVYAGIRKEPEPTVLLLRGDLTKPGPQIMPAMLSGVRNIPGQWQLPVTAPEAERRLMLARWLTHDANPLPWRVMANRLWQYHFGRGLVETPSDFGFSGGQPSHPELLDYLAMDLRQTGSWKTLHRRIMTSATYQQASQVDSNEMTKRAAEHDADNRLLWRFPARRLEAESVRDAMLAVSGQLNRQQFGPSFKPFTVTVFNTHFYHLHDQDRPEFNRRTVYRASVVTGRNPLLAALDCPAPSLAVPKRQETVTPLQALGLMNDSFVLRQATALADRAKNFAGANSSREQVEEMYAITLSRAPTSEELATGEQLIEHHGARELAWALLNSSEFLFQR
jgi:mono/diheme cytochrome c family protein